ncbi:diguanylate cyclase [uncultured Treponema sp.]|uniref:diguanylate cyclase domain-containing protein n=1 Tax=uncultured Treponema sp. TaxID=162155 RepID=UPI00259277C5|nr:diguanylate cyclase [uncultured Treponema sp.]
MKSLQRKILLLLSGSIIFTTALASIAGLLNATRLIKEDSRKIMNLTCDSKAKEINTWLLSIEQTVNALYRFSINQLSEDNTKWTDETYMQTYTRRIRAVMENAALSTDCAMSVYLRFNPDLLSSKSGVFLVKQKNGSFADTSLTDLSLYSHDDREHVCWYYEPIENGRPTWVSPYENKNIYVEMISYVIPIFRNGMTIGVIGMDIDLNLLKQKTKAITVYETGNAMLVSAEGDIVYAKKYPQGLQSEAFDTNITEIKEQMSSDKTESQIHSYMLEGKKRLLAFRSLQNEMTLIIIVPADEINSTTNQLVIQCLLILAAGLTVSLVVSVRLTGNLKKSLLDLTQSAEELSKGNYSVAISCESNDEIGMLAKTLSEAAKTVDISNRRINRLAYTDSLTGLNNRHFFTQFCTDHEGLTYRNTGVLFCDLNGLKRTNDSHGHEAGDRLIATFADILKNKFPEEICCRLGGDEFIVIAENKDRNIFFQQLEEFHFLNEQNEIPFASVGCCWMPSSPDISRMVKAAEMEMYRNKEALYKAHPDYHR